MLCTKCLLFQPFLAIICCSYEGLSILVFRRNTRTRENRLPRGDSGACSPRVVTPKNFARLCISLSPPSPSPKLTITHSLLSIDCLDKTKAIVLANHNRGKQHNEPIRTRNSNTCNRRQARENACEQVTIGLGFTSG